MSFELDVKSANTEIFPVVELNGKYYSTNNVSINISNTNNAEFVYCKPLLTAIPSIKESIDLESHNFKSSNITLQFNNFPLDGVRLSDSLSDSYMINSIATVYFKSPSELKEVYSGIVRSVSHDDKNMTLKTEGLFAKKTNLTVPIQKFEDTPDVPESSKNARKQFVYGAIKRCPLQKDSLINGDIEYEDNMLSSLVLDYATVKGIQPQEPITYGSYTGSDPNDPITDGRVKQTADYLSGVFVKDGDGYFQIQTYYDNLNGISYNEGENVVGIVTNDGIVDSIYFEREIIDVDANGENKVGTDVQAYLTHDIYPAHKYVYPNWVENWDDNHTNVGRDDINSTQYPENKQLAIDALKDKDSNYGVGFYSSVDDDGERRDGGIRISVSPLNSSFICNTYIQTKIRVNNDADVCVNCAGEAAYLFYAGRTPMCDVDTVAGQTSAGIFQDNTDAGGTYISGVRSWNNFSDEGMRLLPNPSGDGGSWTSVDQYQYFLITLVNLTDEGNFSAEGNEAMENRIIVQDAVLYQQCFIDNLLSRDFFADVQGRIYGDELSAFVNQFIYAPSNFSIQNPIAIALHILINEMGFSFDNDIDQEEFGTSIDIHRDFNFGFCQSEAINGKSLVEDLLRYTKSFLRVKSNGKIGLVTIKDGYNQADYEAAHSISNNDVISFKFSKTQPEKIFRKVILNYNKDYSDDAFKDSVEFDKGIEPYYNIDSLDDSTYEIDSPYIREKLVAEKAASYILRMNQNDHLSVSISLPNKFAYLEIGDLIKFRELLSDMDAYGVDYRHINVFNDGQFSYPLFIIKSISKSLGSVKIVCEQLHLLSNDNIIDDFFYNGLGQSDTGGEFFFNDIDNATFYIQPPAPHTNTAPVFESIPTLDLNSFDGEDISFTLPIARCVDGDYIGTDISHLVDVAFLGITYNQLIYDFDNPITFEASIGSHTAIYTVTSPVSGISTTEILTVTISNAFPPYFLVTHGNSIHYEDLINAASYYPSENVLEQLPTPRLFEQFPSNNMNINSALLHHIEVDEDIVSDPSVPWTEYYDNFVIPNATIRRDIVLLEQNSTETIKYGKDAIDWMYENGHFDDGIEGHAEVLYNQYLGRMVNPTIVSLTEEVTPYSYSWDFDEEAISYYNGTIGQGYAVIEDADGLYSLYHWNVIVVTPRANMEEYHMPGDISLDGQANLIDLVNLVNYILSQDNSGEFSDMALNNADYNQDGSIDTLDVVLLANQILGD